jgi:hypothetical protein
MDPEPAPPKVTGCHLTRSAGYSKIANYSNHFYPPEITDSSNHFTPTEIKNYSNHFTPS